MITARRACLNTLNRLRKERLGLCSTLQVTGQLSPLQPQALTWGDCFMAGRCPHLLSKATGHLKHHASRGRAFHCEPVSATARVTAAVVAHLQAANSEMATWGAMCSSHRQMVELSEVMARNIRAQSAASYTFMKAALAVGSLLCPASHTDMVAPIHLDCGQLPKTLIACAEP